MPRLMVACICHLIFSATTHYFFKKYCIVANLSQHIIFWKNNVLWQTCHNTIFFQKIMLWQSCHNTLFFFQKILCCGKFVTTQYFFEKNNVLWPKKIRWQIHATIKGELRGSCSENWKQESWLESSHVPNHPTLLTRPIWMNEWINK